MKRENTPLSLQNEPTFHCGWGYLLSDGSPLGGLLHPMDFRSLVSTCKDWHRVRIPIERLTIYNQNHHTSFLEGRVLEYPQLKEVVFQRYCVGSDLGLHYFVEKLSVLTRNLEILKLKEPRLLKPFEFVLSKLAEFSELVELELQIDEIMLDERMMNRLFQVLHNMKKLKCLRIANLRKVFPQFPIVIDAHLVIEVETLHMSGCQHLIKFNGNFPKITALGIDSTWSPDRWNVGLVEYLSQFPSLKILETREFILRTGLANSQSPLPPNLKHLIINDLVDVWSIPYHFDHIDTMEVRSHSNSVYDHVEVHLTYERRGSASPYPRHWSVTLSSLAINGRKVPVHSSRIW